MTTNSIERLYAQFHSYLEENPFQGNPLELYEAKNYLLNLGGKRARPIALLAANQATDKADMQLSLNAAWAFEVFHNFTLAHDDIMDNALKRRSKNTLHIEYDLPTAILAGDNMQLFVYQKLMTYEPHLAFPLMELITTTGIEICEGQFMDMQFERSKTVMESDYIEMIRLKTAVFLGACLKAGGILGNAKENDLNLLYSLGVNLGIGFQIMDDILDAFSDNPKVGKIKGGDILANKKTILLINAMEQANDIQAKELNTWLEKTEFDPKEKVDAVVEIFNELQIEQQAKAKMNTYYDQAIQQCKKLSFDDHKKSILFEFIEFITNRQH